MKAFPGTEYSVGFRFGMLCASNFVGLCPQTSLFDAAIIICREKVFRSENITKLSQRLVSARSFKWYHQSREFSLHQRLLCDTPAELFIETKTMFELQLWQGIFHGLCFQLQEQILYERVSLFYFPHEFLIADRKTFRPIFTTKILCPLYWGFCKIFHSKPQQTLRNAFEIDFTQTYLQNTERIAFSSHEYFSTLENYSGFRNVIDKARGRRRFFATLNTYSCRFWNFHDKTMPFEFIILRKYCYSFVKIIKRQQWRSKMLQNRQMCFYILVAAITTRLTCFITLYAIIKFLWHTFRFQSSASLACYSFAIRLLSCKAPTLHIYATNGTGISFCFDMVMHGVVNKNIENKFFASFSIVTRNRICDGGVELTCSRFISSKQQRLRWQIHGLRSLFNK